MSSEETCVFRLRDRRICGEPAKLEFDHRVPLCLDHEAALVETVRLKAKYQRDQREDLTERRQAREARALKRAAKDARTAREYARTLERGDETNRLVYYVQRPDGAIKIGTTWELRKRLQAFRHVSPVTLLAVHSGGRPAEAALHQRFGSVRLEGEWFRPAPALLRHIAHVAAVRPVADEQPTLRQKSQHTEAA